MSEDNVNHPKHYAHPSGVEAIDITELLSFNLGNALKYVFRAKHKGNEEEDLKKALWYVNREQRLAVFFEDNVALSVRLSARKVLDVEGMETTLGMFLDLLADPDLDYGHMLDLLAKLFDPEKET